MIVIALCAEINKKRLVITATERGSCKKRSIKAVRLAIS
jgi:hypothetical protein